MEPPQATGKCGLNLLPVLHCSPWHSAVHSNSSAVLGAPGALLPSHLTFTSLQQSQGQVLSRTQFSPHELLSVPL